jgi:hypothetical protein
MTYTKIYFEEIYKFEGGCGCVISSRESGRVQGDVRYIAGHLFKVYMITDRTWRKSRVCWGFVDEKLNCPEYIRKFKANLIGADYDEVGCDF